MGIGRRFSIQRPVVCDNRENPKPTSERCVSVGSVETGRSVEHDGNTFGRSENASRKRIRRTRPAVSDRRQTR